MNYERVREQLQAWLNETHPEYNEGLALLNSYADKPMLFKQLTEYRNPQKLYDSLMALYKTAKEKAANPLPEKKEVKEIIKEIQKAPSEVPKDKILKQLHFQHIQNAKEVDSIKGKLYSIGRHPVTDETSPLSEDEKKQRLALAKMLVGKGGLNDKWKQLNAARDYYTQTGELPLVAAMAEPTIPITGDLYKQQENCRKQISRLKGKIAAAKKELASADENGRLNLLTNINVWEAKQVQEETRMEQIKKQADEQQGH